MSSGYVYVKTAEPSTWVKKHRFIWEAANGPIPKKHVIVFADGNKFNFDLDNLLMLSKAELVTMNHQGLLTTDKELTKTGKLIADVKIAIADRKKRKNNGN